MKPINEADWLSRLNINITSNSNRIFNNGNQQLEISVGLTPRNGQTITEEQLNSVRLVTLEDNGSYQELSGEYRYFQERDPRFDYYADTGSAPTPLLESTTLRKRFYVSSIASGGSRKVIYAAITKSPDEHYVSHTSTFNSSVTIETVTKLRRQRSDFKLEAIDLRQDIVKETVPWDGGSYEGEVAVDLDIYYLEFSNPAFRIVDLWAPFFGKYGRYYSDYVNDGTFFEDSGWYRRPLIGKIHAHYLVHPRAPEAVFTYRHIRVPLNTRTGALSLVRLKLRGRRPALEYTPKAPRTFDVLDQYGNMHTIEMTTESNGNLINFKMYERLEIDTKL